MFENIIAQPVTGQLKADGLSRRLAPSMLFFGPSMSGKGSTALELARFFSCGEGTAQWNCGCASCVRHRSLLHPDLAMIGPRSFAAEIAASRAAFLRDPQSAPGRSLFIRSLRKLLARFSPAVWEYESKSGRSNPLSLLQSLEEELNELESQSAGSSAETLSASLAKNAWKLEDECVSETIPIAQIRRAAWWSRLSPSGKHKTLIIENAGKMKDEARNSLLKLLEEPPESISIILTAQRRESLLPTILSRLRPYRFVARNGEQEREIIRRIFRDPNVPVEKNDTRLVAAYIDSFMPQPPDKLLSLAALFAASVSRSAAAGAKSRGAVISSAVSAVGGYCAPIADAAGFERLSDARQTIAAMLSNSGNFEGRSFPRFLALTLDLVSKSFEQQGSDSTIIACRDVWKKRLAEAQAANGVWNQKPELALESLFYRLKEDLSA